MFDAVVGDTVNVIYNMMQEHFEDEKNMAAKGGDMLPNAEERLNMKKQRHWLFIRCIFIGKKSCLY